MKDGQGDWSRIQYCIYRVPGTYSCPEATTYKYFVYRTFDTAYRELRQALIDSQLFSGADPGPPKNSRFS